MNDPKESNDDKPLSPMQQIAQTYRPAQALNAVQLEILMRIQQKHSSNLWKSKNRNITKLIWQGSLAACVAGLGIAVGLSFATLGNGYYSPSGDIQRGFLSTPNVSSPSKLYFEGQQFKAAQDYAKASQKFKSIIESENIEGSIRASAAWQVALMDITQQQTTEAASMMKFLADNNLEEYISLNDRMRIWCRIARMNLLN